MADEKRIKLTRVKYPTCKLSLFIRPSVRFRPACRGPLPKPQRVWQGTKSCARVTVSGVAVVMKVEVS